MRKCIQIFILLFVFTTSCASLTRESYYEDKPVSFQVFYDQLEPHGQWVDYPSYGYIWIPNVRESFAPYSTNGYWALTQYGWSWMSDYNWGWATFHYGRWGFNNALGWFWVPGYKWGSAWVHWLHGNGYYGWSPIGPGKGIKFIHDGRYDRQHDHWSFVRERDFGKRNIYRYYADRLNHEKIMRTSRVINRTYTDRKRNTTFNYGPDRASVQRASGATVNLYYIRESNKPGQEFRNNELRIYRPQIDKRRNTRETAPSRVVKRDDVIRTQGRDVPNQNQRINPTNNSVKQPEKKDVPQRIDAPTVPNRDVNQPARVPQTTPTDLNRPVRQQDVTTPQRRTEPTPNRTVTPRRDNTPARQSITTDKQETKIQETQSTQNSTAAPRRSNAPARQSRTANRQETKKQETQKQERNTRTERRR